MIEIDEADNTQHTVERETDGVGVKEEEEGEGGGRGSGREEIAGVSRVENCSHLT